MPPNRFDRMEWAGAFGDLGTLIPFVVAYIAVVKMDPFGVFFSLGTSMLASGLYYRTPFPVQPMKAIGAVAATQAAQTATITQNTIYGAGLVTGLAWLVLGLTGAARHVGRWAPRPVVVGIVFGLGLGFMLEGVKMMSGGWLVASIAMAGTLLLRKSKVLPAMFLLLLFGAACGIAKKAGSSEFAGGSENPLSTTVHRALRYHLEGHSGRRGTVGSSATAPDAGQCGDRNQGGKQPSLSRPPCHGKRGRHLHRRDEPSERRVRRCAHVSWRGRNGRACGLWREDRRCADHSGNHPFADGFFPERVRGHHAGAISTGGPGCDLVPHGRAIGSRVMRLWGR